MASKYVCDGCGKERKADFDGLNHCKPHDWYQRADEEGVQDACSRECIETVSKKSSKTGVVLPF